MLNATMVGSSSDAAATATEEQLLSTVAQEQMEDYQTVLGAYKFASAAGGDHDSPPAALSTDEDEEDEEDVADSEEYIDDREDVRRRTLQMQRPSRLGISDSCFDINEARIANFPTTPKSQDKVKTISRVLVRHFLFSTLNDGDIARIASIMDLEEFAAGSVILSKGEPNDTFFIVLGGEAAMEIAPSPGSRDSGTGPVVLTKGGTFGDVALMYESPNDATVTALSAVQCASLERRTYKMIVTRAMAEKRKKYISFLSSIPVFSGLSSYELECVAEGLKEDYFVEGQRILTAGTAIHWMHFIVEGTAEVLLPASEEGADPVKIATLQPRDFAGEIELLHRHLVVADVVALSPSVKTAKLNRRRFEGLPSCVRERLKGLVKTHHSYTTYRSVMASPLRPLDDLSAPFDEPPSHLQRTLRLNQGSQ